ncbi:MAG TPA: hypothetical protein VJB94_04385 [Candidatus Nanoarchaeia archaeon]|nr:hypothetical protein [Candidatus Nanoarchaeia archaeon]
MAKIKWFDIVFWLGVLVVALALLLMDNPSIVIVGIIFEILGTLGIVMVRRKDKPKPEEPEKKKKDLKPKPYNKEVAEKERPKKELVIGTTSEFYKKNIMIFVAAVVVILGFIIYQLVNISGKSIIYILLLIFNFVILVLLFVFGTYLIKRKKEAELDNKPLIETEKELNANKKVSKFVVLRHYVRKALEKDFSREQIVKAALAAGWPVRFIEKAYKREIKRSDIISTLIKGYETKILKRYIKTAMEDGFKKDEIIAAAKNAGWPDKIIENSYDALEGKELVFRKEKEIGLEQELTDEEEEKQTKNILKVTAKLIKHETDFDRLYNLVKKRGAMKLSEVSKEFNISKKQAEEWGQILEDHELIELYYPVIGEPELRWKKSKATG